MKIVLSTLLLFTLSQAAMAQYERVIKECSTVLQLPGKKEKIPTLYRIFSDGKNHRAVYIQEIAGRRIITPEDVKILNEEVGTDLTWEASDAGELNTAESLILHAKMMTEEKSFNGFFKAGLKLDKVRSATVYVVGETTRMGSTSIVEAKDKNGKDLGSFLGGFLLFPCKK